jgi:putative ABC transport system permease protein
MPGLSIALVAVVLGAQTPADDPGSYVVVRSVRPEAADGAKVAQYGITHEDYARVLATVPTIRAAVPIREMAKEVRVGSRSQDARVVATTEGYFKLSGLEVDRGRGLTEADNERYENYAVIGPSVVEALFPDGEPLGKAIKVGSDYYTIVGVTKRGPGAAGAEALLGREPGDEVLIPLNTARLRFGERIIDNRDGIFRAEEVQLSRVVLDVGEAGEAAVRQVESAVKSHHPDGDVAVELVTPGDPKVQDQVK